ncbi:MAG: hypothetical protein Q8O00_12545, partial [Holophaga sp.]|nr:hypothetical protein [Holophaga sp.]
MNKMQIRSNWGSRQATLFTFFCLLVAGALGILAGEFGTIRDFEPNGVATASRTLNQFMAVAATSIALIIPLTANLY